MINDQSILLEVFDQMSSCLNVSNDHEFFDNFLWCESWLNWNFNWPSFFIKLKMNFFILKHLKFYTFFSVCDSNFRKILYLFDQGFKLLNGCLRMFFKKLIKINFGCNDILNSFITEFVSTFYDVLFNSTLFNHLAFKIHFNINGKC